MFGNVPRDIVVLISSDNASTERRITPSWTISTLKSKLEPVTGIPPSAQKLSYQHPDGSNVTILEGLNEDTTQIVALHWQPYTKVHVSTVFAWGLPRYKPYGDFLIGALG